MIIIIRVVIIYVRRESLVSSNPVAFFSFFFFISRRFHLPSLPPLSSPPPESTVRAACYPTPTSSCCLRFNVGFFSFFVFLCAAPLPCFRRFVAFIVTPATARELRRPGLDPDGATGERGGRGTENRGAAAAVSHFYLPETGREHVVVGRDSITAARPTTPSSCRRRAAADKS